METLIALEDDKITLPSVVFFNLEERRPVYGRQALSEYLEGYEGRLMRSLKSLLGSKLLKSETTVLGSAMPFKEILGLFLGTLKQRAETAARSEEHTSELQSLMRISYAVFCLKKKTNTSKCENK